MGFDVKTDYYKILDVDQNATAKEIHKGFQKQGEDAADGLAQVCGELMPSSQKIAPGQKSRRQQFFHEKIPGAQSSLRCPQRSR
jgi:hypothetical protein